MNSVFDIKALTKTIGQNSASSFLDLVLSSRDELQRFGEAIELGLEQGATSLRDRDESTATTVAGWFDEVGAALREIREKMNSDDFSNFAKRLEKEAKKKPWFAVSANLVLRSFQRSIRRKDARLSQ